MKGDSALQRADRIGRAAAGEGFDWPDVSGPIAKVREELLEIEEVIAADPPLIGPLDGTTFSTRAIAPYSKRNVVSNTSNLVMAGCKTSSAAASAIRREASASR